MRKSTVTILLLTLTFVGCLSPQMEQDLEDSGAKIGKKIAAAAATEAEERAKVWYDKGFAAGKAALEAQIKNDAEIPQSTKDELLAQLAGAGGFAGIAGILVAYAKAKGAAKLKKTVGILVGASQELPETSLALLKQEVKKLGGDHPSIASVIAEVKST